MEAKMSMKTLLVAGIVGLAGLALSGCVSDPYYYDDYPLYRGGYYSGVTIYDSGLRVRPHHHRQRHVERPHRAEHWRDYPPRISRRGPDRNHYQRRWQDASAVSPDRRFDRDWRYDGDRLWIRDRSSRR